MKRLLQILGLLILLLLGTAIVLPIVFKDEIIDGAKKAINENVNAKVEFEDIGLSLFSSFPNFSLSVHQFTVDGVGQFEGVRLADISEFSLELDLMSVIFGDQFEIESIALKETTVNVLVNEDGSANYDIAKASEAATEETDVIDTSSAGTQFSLSLKNYSIENFNLNYIDNQGKIEARIVDLDHSGKGDFTQDVVDLKTNTDIQGIDVVSEGIAYLKRTGLKSTFNVEFDQTEQKISFGENDISLNDLHLNFTGFIAIPGDDINMDIDFAAPQNSFKSVLSLIPAVFQKDFEDVKTEGDFELKGKVAGAFNGEKEVYPAFDILFKIDNASFQYPDLPSSVNGILVNTHIYNKSSDLDGMVIDIAKAQANVADNPINANMVLKTPMSNPNIKAHVNTDLDLANIAKVVPMEGLNYSGNIKANLDLQASMQDVDNEDYEKILAEGEVMVNALSLKGDSVPMEIEIAKAEALFSPQYVDLKQFNMNLGKSDVSLVGKVDNMLSYLLKDEMLHARFDFKSNLLDLDDLTSSAEEEPQGNQEIKDTTSTPVASDSAVVAAVRIPQNIDFELNSEVDKVLFGDLTIENLKGDILLKEGEARMNDVEMNTLGGSLSLNGGYDSKPNQPEIDMDMAIKDFGFKESFDAFEMVRQMAPIMGKTTGNYSSSFSLVSKLNDDMSPNLNSVVAAGNLFSKGISTSPNSLQKLSSVLKNPDLATLDVSGVDIKFKIEDGKITVEPFDVNAGNVSANVYGSQSLDQTMDYTMDMKLPISGLSSSGLLGSASNSGKVDLQVKIGGTTSDPKIKTSLRSLVGNVVDNIKEQVQEKVDEVKEDLTKKANEEAQKLIDQASAKGDQLITEAEKQAQSIRDVATDQADKLRKEADAQATKLEEEAKGNFLKEAAAKEGAKRIRDTADEKAQKLEDEANAKADALVQKAKDEKQRLIKEAEEKGKV